MITKRARGPVTGRARPPEPGAFPARRGWSVLILLSVAEFMVVLDMTVVNVALPSIARSLHFSPSGLQWVVTAYILLTGGLTLAGGRAADLLGRRRIFLAGLALFTVASLASGLAPAAGPLIAARAAQGLGAALLTPAALSVITATYAGTQRTTALAAWGAIASGGAGAGLLAGGMLTTWLGWRSVFLINVPVGVAAGLLALRLVRPAPPAGGGRRGLDLPGAVLLVAGLAAAVYAITGTAQHGWGSARTLLLLAASAGLLAAFAVAERAAGTPLVPPSAWRSRSLVTGALLMFGAMGILAGTFFLNTLYLQDVLHASPLRAGLEFLPLVLAVAVAAHLASRLLPRAGSRLVAAAGLTLVAGGALLLAGHPAGAGYAAGLLPGLVVLGTGTGLAIPAASVTTMADAGAGQEGLASGLMMTAHEVGAAVGIAALSAVATAGAGAGALLPGGLADGYRLGFTVAAGIAAALAVAALLAAAPVRPGPGARTALH